VILSFYVSLCQQLNSTIFPYTTLFRSETVNVNESFDEKVHTEGSPNERIAVLSLEGTIEDAPENILGEESAYQHLLGSIERAATDSTVEAVVLRVNSPGGGVLES